MCELYRSGDGFSSHFDKNKEKFTDKISIVPRVPKGKQGGLYEAAFNWCPFAAKSAIGA
jgi:hypothetical protein